MAAVGIIAVHQIFKEFDALKSSLVDAISRFRLAGVVGTQ